MFFLMEVTQVCAARGIVEGMIARVHTKAALERLPFESQAEITQYDHGRIRPYWRRHSGQALR